MTATTVYGPSTVKRHRRTTSELAAVDNAIVTAVETDWPVSLRGVYYRVVSAGAVDKTEAAYRTVGRRLLKLRRDGRVGYDRITDGTRWVIHPRRYDDLEDALRTTAALYRRRLWNDQDVAVHFFTEKDAITGVVEPITSEWDVPLGVLRGYCSESFAHEMGQAIRDAGKPVVVYQLGDHDPSGVGAWTDFQNKVSRFAAGAEVTFERLAVTEDQITELSLPTRPTKSTDTRSRNFTGGSVEVDAIPAPMLRQIVSGAIERHVDPHRLDVVRLAEREERAGLFALARGEEWSG